MRRVAFMLWCLNCSCIGDTGREHVQLSLSARGTAPSPVTLGAATLTLTRAELAFGPAYLCASDQGRAEFCELAMGELRETRVLDALDPNPQPLGTMAATTGSVGSLLYDYGISWLLTQPAPRVSSSAAGGHSALLEATLTEGARSLRLRAEIDITPHGPGELAINGQRTQHEIRGDEPLTLLVDPQRWLDRLDPSALLALDADGDGQLTILAGTPAYESIVQGLVNRAPVALRWE